MSVFFNFFVDTGLTQSNNVAASSNYTVMFWTKIIEEASDGLYKLPFLRRNAGNTAYMGVFAPDNTIPRTFTLNVNNGSGVVKSAPIQYVMGRWYHIAIVSTGSSHKIVIDGVAKTPITVDMTATVLSTLILGHDGTSLAGTQTAYFREWNVALTDAQILLERLSTIPVKTTNLITDTPLATDILDDTANANNWISTGGDPTEFGSQPILTIYDNILVTTTNRGPDGNFGRNVMIYDRTTGILLGANSCIDNFQGAERLFGIVIYRPEYNDFLVGAVGFTQGGHIYRFDRYFNQIEDVELAIPALPSTDLWDFTTLRTDHNGKLYAAYFTSPGINTGRRGDTFLREIDNITFQPVGPHWQTFTPIDGRNFMTGDFSLDGNLFFFAMTGTPALGQNIIQQLNLATSTGSLFATYGTWSGGINPTGDSYTRHFLRPRLDGSYVAATFHTQPATPTTVSILLISAGGTVTAVYPLQIADGSTSASWKPGLVLTDNNTLYYVDTNGRIGRVDLTTGIETIIVSEQINPDESVVALGDLAIPTSIPESSLTIIKASSPSSGTKAFTFNITGGLTPSTFDLSTGQNRLYPNIAPGVYSLTEVEDLDWVPEYAISTGGTDNININVPAGVNVVVTVTNKLRNDPSGIYFINPNKPTHRDKYYTQEKKIPNPTVKTALLGE